MGGCHAGDPFRFLNWLASETGQPAETLAMRYVARERSGTWPGADPDALGGSIIRLIRAVVDLDLASETSALVLDNEERHGRSRDAAAADWRHQRKGSCCHARRAKAAPIFALGLSTHSTFVEVTSVPALRKRAAPLAARLAPEHASELTSAAVAD